eukprot:13500334-Alexandrium_andersonii.AAC.1
MGRVGHSGAAGVHFDTIRAASAAATCRARVAIQWKCEWLAKTGPLWPRVARPCDPRHCLTKLGGLVPKG